MENTLQRIAKCRYKTKMDKRSGFWQVDLTAAAQECWPLQPLRVVCLSGRLCLLGWLMPGHSSKN